MPKEDTQFKPGQSGNPGGRPKGSMKDYVRRMFAEMNDEQKKAWLKSNKINPIDMWKMGEGLPKADMELNGEMKTKVISADE